MEQYFLIYQERVLIRYEALFYFGINMDVVGEMIQVAREGTWESVYLNRDGTQRRYIVIESIPENVRTKFKIPTPLEIRESDVSRSINLDEYKASTISKLKIFIDDEYREYMIGEDKHVRTHFMRYLNEGHTQENARILSKAYGILGICYRYKRWYTVDVIYHALAQLIEENKDNNKYSMAYQLPSLRTFFDHMNKGSENQIDSVIIHGLTGKPGNRKPISKATERLVVELLKHCNHWSDETVKSYANTIIIAEPEKYNNGKKISRQKVNQIKNGGDKNAIKAAIHGHNWIRDNFIPDVHRIKTQYPLDCIEVDFTKLHASVVDERENKVTQFICRIKDRCSRAILGLASGRSECFDLFQIAFRRMLDITSNRLPAEIVYDPSPAFGSKEFDRIKTFINDLKVDTTETGNPRAKGGIESHFRTLLEVYLPQHVGTLGGNIATTKKHRPKREILILLSKQEYIEDEQEWERILKDINYKYNSTPFSKDDLDGPIENFRSLDKPHSVRLDEQYVAYVSWHHTQRQFLQSEFLVEFDHKKYHFGWDPQDVNDSTEKQKFITERTGDLFDIYMHPEKPHKHPLYVFELGTLKLVHKMPFREMFYGNSIDHKINPSRKAKLLNFLRQRNIMEKDIKKLLSESSRDVKESIGVDLYTLVKEIQKNGEMSGKKSDLVQEILDLLKERDVAQIDPFSSTPLQQSNSKKPSAKQIFRPTKVKHKKSHG